MTFLNPLVLIGLIAASIPLILHLLNLRKLKTVDFSTLKFLKELQKTKIKKLKLKQIILLILRTLIIIFIVLAFARPTIQGTLPLLGSFAKTSAVILIDNSFSMDVSDAWGNRFNQAKNACRNILNSFQDGDEATIISLADLSNLNHSLNKNELNNINLTRNLNFLKENLSNFSISFNSANIKDGVIFASSLLENSININKEIFIISDAQNNTFKKELIDSFKINLPNTTIYFIPIGANKNQQLANYSIDSVNVISRIFQQGKPVEIEAFIRNNSETDLKGLALSMFFNEERVAQRTVDLLPNETKAISISAPTQIIGSIDAYVEIEGDALDTDNRRYFSFIVPEKPKVALIGSKEINKYISFALEPKQTLEASANLSIFEPTDAARIDFNSFDMLIIAGGPLQPNDFSRLKQYVSSGGGLLLFADPQSNEQVYQKGMQELGFGFIGSKTYAMQEPARFLNVDKNHQLFEGMFKEKNIEKQTIESPNIYKSLIFQGEQQIIEIPGGGFLTENKIGDGKILYFAVSPTFAYSSFPVTGLFPALLYRSTYYLSSIESFGNNYLVGSQITYILPNKYSNNSSFKIIDPQKVEFFSQAATLPTGSVLALENTNQTGNFTVLTPANKPIATFSINTDASESVLISQSDNNIKEFIEEIIKEPRLEMIDEVNEIQQNIKRVRTGTELWQLFVALALLTVIAEMFVAKVSKNDLQN